MFEQLPLSALAIPLRPVVKAVINRASRLRNERKAGQRLAVSTENLMENSLDETLGRLRGGNVEDSWWRRVLDRLGQSYIAPDFLRQPALREWLHEDRVVDDLKALAAAIISGSDDPNAQARLARSYANRTGEETELAKQPVDVTVAIIVAGYIASIPADQRPLAGMFQELSSQVQDRFDRFEESHLSALADPIIQQAHTDQATQKLSEIVLLRTIDSPGARRNIQELLNRVSQGDLAATDSPTKERVRYWCARLCAADPETLEFAKQVRNQLGQTNSDMNLLVVDALLAELEGDVDSALRLLRDHDDRDSRTALFGLLTRSRGEKVALDWYAQQSPTDDDQLFSDVGWRNWAICMATIGEWGKAAQRLTALETPRKESPALALIEGTVNAAMLLPDDHREIALTGVPIYPNIVSNLGAEIEQYHARATTCFELAQRCLSGLVDRNLTRVISDWLLWLRIMNPNPDAIELIRKEISQGMETDYQAVNLILFAWAFKIPFNPAPLGQHLEYRKTLGGLNKDELLAEFLLSEQFMDARDRIRYMERHEAPLRKIISPSVLVGMHIEALLADNQIERARSTLVREKKCIEEQHFDRLVVLIDAHDGHDPLKQLESLYRQRKRLIDLQNLVFHLKRVDDHVALLPLAKELFAHQRTVDNALSIVMCFGDPTSFDHRSIIEFLEDNSDLVAQSDDLKEAKAVALFRAGGFQDSRVLNDVLLNSRKNKNDLRLSIKIAIASGDWERLEEVINRTWRQRSSEDPDTLMTVAQLAGQQDKSPDRSIQLGYVGGGKSIGRSPNPHRRLLVTFSTWAR